jgi:hypothetical protein
VSSTDSEGFHGCNEVMAGLSVELSRLNIHYQNQGGKKSTLHSV